MRDFLVTAIVLGSLPVILFRPYVGVLMWVWISMMNPHRLTFGFAYSYPFAMIIAITTLVAWLISPRRNGFPLSAISVLMLLFTAWMCWTSLFAIQAREVVMVTLTQVLKTQLMLFVTMMIIRGREQIEKLIWAIVISVGYYGVKGGLFTIVSSGTNLVWGPPGSFIEGNNEIGLAVAMLVPLMYYLSETTARKWVRYGLWVAMALCAFAVLGTHSRGAFLAAGAAALLLGLKSRRPVMLTLLFGVALVAMILFMPDNWTERMNTIETYDQDASALGRINTWRTIWNMVLDHPIVGGGFDLDNVTLFQLYSIMPNQQILAPHSIYFQVLGEHGFVGFAIYMALGFMVWRRSQRLAHDAASHPDQAWVTLLMRMVQVSLLVFAVGGAFLGLLHYDLPYYLAAIVVLVEAAYRQSLANRSALERSGIAQDHDAPLPAPRQLFDGR